MLYRTNKAYKKQITLNVCFKITRVRKCLRLGSAIMSMDPKWNPHMRILVLCGLHVGMLAEGFPSLSCFLYYLFWMINLIVTILHFNSM